LPGQAAPSVGPSSPAAVLARDLSVGYGGEVIVGGIDLSVGPGTSLALVGTNGSGKSTLLKTLIGIQPRLDGDLHVLGLQPGNAPRRVGSLPQFHASGSVLPLRAIDVARMARFPSQGLLGRATTEDRDLVAWAMELMGVTDLARAPLRSLSGGQRQRVYLAQVLARRADLILLDEPNAGLDAGGRERYLDAFAGELRRGATIVTATHDISEAIEYDQVLLLARRVVALGPGREVLTPDRLMETFGIVIRDPHVEHAGRFTVAERSHGAPQVVDLSLRVHERSLPRSGDHEEGQGPGNAPDHDHDD
jgi:ABC-type Mn2+/Zn2+ transport system ATPase subunit